MNVILSIITRRQVRRLSTVHARQASTTRKTIHDTANSNANTGSRRLRDQGDLLRSLHALQLGFSGQPTTTTPRLKGHTECTAVCAQGNGRARAWHWTIVPPRSIACTTWQTLVPHTDLGGWRRIKNGVRSPLPSFLPPSFRPPTARHSTHALHCTRHTTHPHELDCALHTPPPRQRNEPMAQSPRQQLLRDQQRRHHAAQWTPVTQRSTHCQRNSAMSMTPPR